MRDAVPEGAKALKRVKGLKNPYSTRAASKLREEKKRKEARRKDK